MKQKAPFINEKPELRRLFPFSETQTILHLLPGGDNYFNTSYSDNDFRLSRNCYHKQDGLWVGYASEHLLCLILKEAAGKEYDKVAEMCNALKELILWIIEDSTYLLVYPDDTLSAKRKHYNNMLREIDLIESAISVFKSEGLGSYLERINSKILISGYLNYPDTVAGIIKYMAITDRAQFNRMIGEALHICKFLSSIESDSGKSDRFDYLNQIVSDNDMQLLSDPSLSEINRTELISSNILLCRIMILSRKDIECGSLDCRLVQARLLRYLAALSQNFGELLINCAINALNGSFSFSNELDWFSLSTFSPELLAETIGQKLQNVKEMAVKTMDSLNVSACELAMIDREFSLIFKNRDYGACQIPKTRIELIKDKFYIGLVTRYDHSKPDQYKMLIKDVRDILSHEVIDINDQKQDVDPAEPQHGKPFAVIGDNLFVRITGKNQGGLVFEVDDVDFHSETGRIPFVNVTPAYSSISNFEDLFSIGDYICGTVESVNPMVLTIKQELNFLFTDDIPVGKRLTAKVTGDKNG